MDSMDGLDFMDVPKLRFCSPPFVEPGAVHAVHSVHVVIRRNTPLGFSAKAPLSARTRSPARTRQSP